MNGLAQVLVNRVETETEGGVPLYHVTVTTDNQGVAEALAVAIQMLVGVHAVDPPSLDS